MSEGYNPPASMVKKVFLTVWLPVGLLILFLAVRLPGLGRFATIDEVYWLNRSVAFRSALFGQNWGMASVSPHPGVTTVWAGALGIQLRLPDLGEGSTELTDFHLRHYLWEHETNPVELIALGRSFVVLFCAIGFLALWPFLVRLSGKLIAGLGMLLIATEPFIAAHQRLLHQDGLMAILGLLTMVSFAAFIKSRRRSDLVISGAAAGLAWLTKTPMLALVPAIALVSVWGWARDDRGRATLVFWVRSLLLWIGAGVVTLFIVWPAMWADPFGTVSNAVGYALNSAEGLFSGPIFFNGAIFPDGKLGWSSLIFYPEAILWRTTPLFIVGLVGATLRPRERKGIDRALLFALLCFVAAFLVGMTIAEKKFDRYMLPAYVCLAPIAGFGLAQLMKLIMQKTQITWRRTAAGFVLLAALSIQFFNLTSNFPSYLSYYNPLLGGPAAAQNAMMIGWGEGLEAAGVYLQERASQQATIAAWYSNLTALFVGLDLVDIPISLQLSNDQLNELLQMDYLVIYIHQWQRGTPQNLLDALAPLEPEHRVWINGIEYARVYHLNEN